MAYLTDNPNGHPVFESLRRAIIRGVIPPGARVIERELAAELGVSRTPVREALARLERDGLLRAAAGRRRNLLEVAPLHARDLQQASEATAALEGIGAVAATAEPEARRLVLAAELDAVLESAAGEIASASGSFARALELDERFHRLLADDFLEPFVAACLETVRTNVYRYVWMYSPKTGIGAVRFKAEHAPIVAALRLGDAATVRSALQANWSAFATRITPFLEDRDEAG